jgi:hypothetical protein
MRGGRIRQIFASNGQIASDTEYFKECFGSAHHADAIPCIAGLGKNLPVID